MKNKITQIVEDYRTKYPLEYKQVCDYLEQQRKKLDNQEYGNGKGELSALMEIPWTLHKMIEAELSLEERQEFSRLENKKWFAKTFKEFALPTNV